MIPEKYPIVTDEAPAQPGRGFTVIGISTHPADETHSAQVLVRFDRDGKDGDAFTAYKAYTKALKEANYTLGAACTPLRESASFVIPIDVPKGLPFSVVTEALKLDMPKLNLGAKLSMGFRDRVA